MPSDAKKNSINIFPATRNKRRTAANMHKPVQVPTQVFDAAPDRRTAVGAFDGNTIHNPVMFP